MGEPSVQDAYSYAKFLVDIFPKIAIEILRDKRICDLAQVEERVDNACVSLGGKNEIKGMVEGRRFEELRVLKAEGGSYLSPSSALTPHRGLPAGQTPPSTPGSVTSGPTHRVPNYEMIIVHYGEDKLHLSASSSGSEACLIGEDKLERFPDIDVRLMSPAQTIDLGGRRIEVSHHVHLTWSRPEHPSTQYGRFWVVRPELIRSADVLLRYKPSSRGTKGKNLLPSDLCIFY